MSARGLTALRFGIGAAVAAAVAAVFFVIGRPGHGMTAPTARSKAVAVPVLAPSGARPLVWARPLHFHARPLPRPRGQIAHADWLWPLGPDSSLAYVLHDGQSRWVVDGRVRALPGAPTDPIGAFAAAPNGSRIAYQRGSGVEVEGLDTQTFIPNATDPAFLANGQLIVLRPEPDGFSVLEGRALSRFTGVGTPFAAPYLSPAEVMVDDRGILKRVDWQSRKERPMARVNPRRWPHAVAAGSLSGGSWFLLSRPTALPTYLLVMVEHGQAFYHVWQSPTPPEAASVGGRLAITWLRPSGALAVVQGSRMHPLAVTPGVFSVSPQGLVYQGGAGRFVALGPLP